jgi:hypothetical protein
MTMDKRNFKWIIFSLSACMLSFILSGPGWTRVSEPEVGVSADFPEKNLIRVDTLGLIMYSSLTEDSLAGAQLFIYKDFSLRGNEELSEYMQLYGEKDTLSAIARYMLAVSEGKLIYLKKQISNKQRKILDIGIKYPNNDTFFITYSRIHIENGRLAIINVFAQEPFQQPLINTRNRCFNTLLIK